MLSSVDANARIDPSMGPIQGVQPKPTAIPTSIQPRAPLLLLV